MFEMLENVFVSLNYLNQSKLYREGAAVFTFKRPRLTAEMLPTPAIHTRPSPATGPEEGGSQPSQQAEPRVETGKNMNLIQMT